MLEYYYRGVASWNWYYPYHYAPMASDLRALPAIPVNFTLGSPFLPYEQLLAVQPASSYRLLPEPYWWLMRDAASSPIIDFYPTEFRVDMEGKREWVGCGWAAVFMAVAVVGSLGERGVGALLRCAALSFKPDCSSKSWCAAHSARHAPPHLAALLAACHAAGADWEGVVLSPFIDQDRLLAAAASVPPGRLTAEERQRNTLGDIIVFSHHPGAGFGG